MKKSILIECNKYNVIFFVVVIIIIVVDINHKNFPLKNFPLKILFYTIIKLLNKNQF